MNEKLELEMGNILLEALEKDNACSGCVYNNLGNCNPNNLGKNYDFKCRLCHKFLDKDSIGPCPCLAYGKDGARKLSWIALEERGII